MDTAAKLAVTLTVLSGMMMLSADGSGWSLNRTAAGYDRPFGNRHQSRSVVLAKHGLVATSHPLAAQVGLEVLRAGGNAADAAVAVNAMLGVVEPMSCGIGGDLFAIYWDHETQKIYGLNASGRSPHRATSSKYRELGLETIPVEGPLSWSVSGCVGGWESLLDRFGTRTLETLLAPAIAAAEDGFPVTEIIAGYWSANVEALADHPHSAATYLIEGRPPRFGETFRNRRLAATYRELARDGAKAFYRGDIAKQIVAFSEDHGGLIAARDLAEHRSEWVAPLSTNYRGYDVWELPPNGQGIAVLQMLNMLEPYDLRSYGPGSYEYLHLLIEAKRLAFADRAKYYADPAFANVPIEQLISKEYARRRGQRIRLDAAAPDTPAGDPRLRRGDTAYMTIVDKDRNCCSLIQSVFYNFGSKAVPGELGFVMQNRGALFALDENHLNRLEPHKRPFHTIIPALVTKDDQPWFCFGVMGGDMQPQGHVQVLVNVIDFGMNVQAAGDAARVRHTGSATPTGKPAAGVGAVMVESGVSPETVAALTRAGHQVARGRAGFGGYQGILIDWKNGVLQGATEPRKDGAAVGY